MNKQRGFRIKDIEEHAQVFHLLAHANRLIILSKLIENEEANVAELTEILATSQANVSKHLKLLKDAKVVSSRRSGNKTYYRLERPQLITIMEFMNDWTNEN